METVVANRSNPSVSLSGKTGRRAALSFRGFLTKSLCLLFVILSSSRILYPTYFIIGLLNWRSRLLKSIFFCYAGSRAYSRHYLFSFCEKWGFEWIPVPIGLLYQGGAWGIAFASPMTEEDFTNSANNQKLEDLLGRLRFIAKILNVEKISLAGILPSFLGRTGRNLDIQTNTKPARAVYASYRQICDRDFKGELVPVILLGGNGSVGQHIQSIFDRNEIQYHVVDPRGGLRFLPHKLFGRKAILIDVARRGVLKKYVSDLWAELVILNETFPEPPKELARALRLNKIKLYHLAGVEGRVYPSLPHGYSESVPCCAIHNESFGMKPVIREINV